MFVVLQTQGAREYMEDTFLAEENFYNGMDLFAVFDGHAGSYVSEFLQRHVKEALVQSLQRTISVEDALFLAVKTIVDTMSPEASKNTGSTYLIVVRKGDRWWFANGGDCRAIVNVGGTAGVLRLTNDHKPNTPKERNRIEEAGGFVTFFPHDVPRVNGMLAISRSVGDTYLSPYVRWEPEVSKFVALEDNRLFVFASDGLWDTMEDMDVINTFMKNIANANGHVSSTLLQECCKECMIIAQSRGSGDNITIIAVVQ